MHEPLASVYGVCMPTIDNKHEEFSFQISIPRIDVDLVTQLQLGCLQPVQPPDWQYRWLAHILLKKICNLSPLLFKIAIWLYLMWMKDQSVWVRHFFWGLTEHESYLQVCLVCLNGIMKHHLADSRPNLSRQYSQLLLILCCWSVSLETGALDAMLNKLKEEGIKFITDLEFMSWIMFCNTGRQAQRQMALLSDGEWGKLTWEGGGVIAITAALLGLQLLLWQRLPKKYWKQSRGEECTRHWTSNFTGNGSSRGYWQSPLRSSLLHR